MSGLKSLSERDQVIFWRTQTDVLSVALKEQAEYRTLLIGQLREAELARDYHISRASEYRGEANEALIAAGLPPIEEKGSPHEEAA